MTRICAGLVLGWSAVVCGQAAVVTVGQGVSADSARRDALRRAVEQVAGQEIASFSQTENFSLVRDTIYAKAEGFVTGYKILSEGAGIDGGYFCRIEATVDASGVRTDWAAIQNMLEQIGRPRIMVAVSESIDDKLVKDGGMLENHLEKRLLDKGFDVFTDAGVIHHGSDVETLRRSAAERGALILILGTSSANAASVNEAHGVSLIMYNGHAQLKAYNASTGRVLGSTADTNFRGGARGLEPSPQAARKAIANGAEGIIEDLIGQVMAQWSTQISAGKEIELIVEGMSAGEALRFEDWLRGLPQVTTVHTEYSGGAGRYRVTTHLTGKELARFLMDDGDGMQGGIEVTEISADRVVGRSGG